MISWTLALSATMAAPVEQPVRYEGHRVLRAHPQSRQQLATVMEVASDVLTHRPTVGPIVVVVAPEDLPALDVTSIEYQVLAADLQHQIDLERQRLAITGQPAPGDPWFEDYRDNAAFNAYMEDLAAEYPERVAVEPVGTSVEGRTIRALHITGSGSAKPQVFITGLQHAREWIAAAVPMCIADALVRGYDDDADIREVLDQVEIVVVPISNPDGYVHTWANDRMWRKNRGAPEGIDLNRNWGVGWGEGEGSSTDPESLQYRGEAPFSEPETAALRDYMLQQSDLVAHIDYHSFGQFMLRPWTYKAEPPANVDRLEAIADAVVQAMTPVHQQEYRTLSADQLYLAAGTITDWAHGEAGSVSFAIELRPGSRDEGNGFSLPPEQIVPTCEENLAGLLQFVDAAVLDPDGEDDGTDGDTGGTATDTGTTGSTETGSTDGPLGETMTATSSFTATTMHDPTATGTTDGSSLSGGQAGCGCRSTTGSVPMVGLLLPVLARRRPPSRPGI